jgi:putative transposase
MVRDKKNTMPFIQLHIHIVFATKYREPFLTKPIRQKVKKHIRENCKEKNIHLYEVDGYYDHLHCLVSLGKTQSVSAVVKLIKGESSLWINKQELLDDYFSWQTQYAAFSVSNADLPRVRKYIRNQESHHRRKSLDSELTDLQKQKKV